MNQRDTSDLVIYELALLQFRPDVTSGELLNIGVIAFSPDSSEFHYRVTDRYGRIKAAYPDLDGPAFRSLTRGIRSQCARVAREVNRDPLDIQRRHSLTMLSGQIVTRGISNFVWSSLRHGACVDLHSRVEAVFDEYVGRLERRQPRTRKDDDRLWKEVVERPRIQEILDEIDTDVSVVAGNFAHTFRGGWMNGHSQYVDTISLDYANPGDMRSQATKWNGIVGFLSASEEFELTAIVTDRPSGEAAFEYDKTVELLQSIDTVRDVIPESQAERLADLISQDLSATSHFRLMR